MGKGYCSCKERLPGNMFRTFLVWYTLDMVKKPILIFFNTLSILLLVFSFGFPIYNFIISKTAYISNSLKICNLSYGSGRSKCYYGLEIKNPTSEFCENWYSVENKEFCYYRLAMKTKDILLCPKTIYPDICQEVINKLKNEK